MHAAWSAYVCLPGVCATVNRNGERDEDADASRAVPIRAKLNIRRVWCDLNTAAGVCVIDIRDATATTCTPRER